MTTWPRHTHETDEQYSQRTGLHQLHPRLRDSIMTEINKRQHGAIRTATDTTSEPGATKRGPSHGTEDPTIAARTRKQVAEATMPGPPQPYDDGHTTLMHKAPPFFTVLDDAETCPPKIYDKQTNNSRKPQPNSRTKPRSTLSVTNRKGWHLAAPALRIQRLKSNSVICMVLRTLNRRDLVRIFTANATKTNTASPDPPEQRQPVPLPTPSPFMGTPTTCHGCTGLFSNPKRLAEHHQLHPDHEHMQPGFTKPTQLPQCVGCMALFTSTSKLDQHHREHPAHHSASLGELCPTAPDKHIIDRTDPDYNQIRVEQAPTWDVRPGAAAKYRAITKTDARDHLIQQRLKHRNTLAQLAKRHFPRLHQHHTADSTTYPPFNKTTRNTSVRFTTTPTGISKQASPNHV